MKKEYGKENVMSSKNMRKLIWRKSLRESSRGGDHPFSDPQLEGWSFTEDGNHQKHFSVKFLKFFLTFFMPVVQL